MMELPPGDTIYFGTVHPLGTDDVAFVYERRVGADGDQLRSTHITRDPEGVPVFVESATHDADYGLLTDTLVVDQRGRTGALSVDGDRLTLTFGERARSERLTDPIVAGPTLVGWIVRHLDELRAGAHLEVRLAVIERARTYAFTASLVEASPDAVRVRLRPDDLLVRAAVGSIGFTFDGDGRIVALEGRVPPKIRVGARWRPLDAHVDYQFVAPRYR